MKLDLGQKTEEFSQTAERLLRGTIQFRTRAWNRKMCDFGDRVLELRMSGELIHALRKRKATDAYSRLEDLGRTARLADDI